MIIGNRKCISDKANALGISPDELIELIVAKECFTNHEEVVAQNIRRYHDPSLGAMPSYIVNFCLGTSGLVVFGGIHEDSCV